MNYRKTFGKRFWFLLILIIGVLTLVACGQDSTTEEADDKLVVTDLADREVEIDNDIETAAVQYSGSGGGFITMMALFGDEVDEHIVGWDYGIKNNRYDMWEAYTEVVPGLEDIPDIGNLELDTFNTEEAISLKPDIVILPLDLFETTADTVDKLEDAGIPTVFIDYHEQLPENHTKTVSLLGEIFGKEERAQDIIDFYDEELEKVTSRLNEIDQDKPTVYIESGNEGPEEYANTYGNMMWGELVELYGGSNIAVDIIENAEPIQPEYILTENPDIIMITGAYWPNNPSSMRLGFQADEEESRELLQAFTERPGWEELDAVKNDRVYSVHHAISREVYDFAAIQFMAKTFYPEEFEDIDPEESLARFYDKFFPVELSGVWTLVEEE